MAPMYPVKVLHVADPLPYRSPKGRSSKESLGANLQPEGF